jgi:hypothetical protein
MKKLVSLLGFFIICPRIFFQPTYSNAEDFSLENEKKIYSINENKPEAMEKYNFNLNNKFLTEDNLNNFPSNAESERIESHPPLNNLLSEIYNLAQEVQKNLENFNRSQKDSPVIINLWGEFSENSQINKPGIYFQKKF